MLEEHVATTSSPTPVSSLPGVKAATCIAGLWVISGSQLFEETGRHFQQDGRMDKLSSALREIYITAKSGNTTAVQVWTEKGESQLYSIIPCSKLSHTLSTSALQGPSLKIRMSSFKDFFPPRGVLLWKTVLVWKTMLMQSACQNMGWRIRGQASDVWYHLNLSWQVTKKYRDTYNSCS